MMEPVAWAYKFKGKSPVLTDEKKDWAVGSSKWTEEPLVRLSDAEARIAELEAENACLKAEREEADHKLVDRYRDPKAGTFSFPGDVAAIVRRLDAAEALLKEAGKVLSDVAEIYSNMETGDGEPCPVVAAARAIHHKIGGKDE